MKIALLGEFSGLHRNLKEGLEELGVTAVTVSNGDGLKEIKSDFSFELGQGSRFSKIKKFKNILSNFVDYDVVQFINPYIYNKFAVFFYSDIFKNNKKIFCLAAGDDVEFIRFLKKGGMSKYSPYDDELKTNTPLPYDTFFDKCVHYFFMKKIQGIIPVMYEYAESYRRSKFKDKTLNTIPLPINLNKIKYKDNKIRDNKLRFYHGETRGNFKGSRFIVEAMERAKEKYPSDIEIIHAKTLPLEQYLNVIDNVNVIIDQCRSYSYGMNAIYSMAMGKIVMSGQEIESLLEFGESESPVINIVPDANQIFNEICKLLENRDKITEWGYKSRLYVENKHSHIKVAKKYISTWGFEI